MGFPVEWLDKFAAAGMTPIGCSVRVDGGHQPASVPYSDQRKGMKAPTGAGLVTPPPNGLSGIELVLAVRVMSESNTRGHWSTQQRRFKAQAAALGAVLDGVTVPGLPVRVLWTKLGGNRLDGDNLSGGFKGLRDALSARYGVSDADGSGIEWDYDQAPGGPHGVRVLIAAAGA